MKYLRKTVALLIGVAFVAAIVIGIGVIYAVKNVNVTILTYSDDEETRKSDYEAVKDTLGAIKGGSILFISEKNVIDALESGDSNYSFVSYEKIYPCTINVTLKERRETFAVSVGGKYSMFDAEGKFLRQSAENINVNDGHENLLIEGIAINEIEEIAKIAADFEAKLVQTGTRILRSTVESIVVDENKAISDYAERLVFNLKSGIKIELVNFRDLTEEKMKSAVEEYSSLTDRQKLGGTIRSYQILESGEVRSLYSPV